MKNLYEKLYEPFPEEVEKTLSKGGARLTYIPVSEVITRLNKVLGVENWSSNIVSCKRDELDPDFIVAHVRIETTINETMVCKDGIGGQKIKRTKNGDIVDLGDEMKGAVSDALKKAAQQLGVGLYLARSEEALGLDEQEQAEAARDPEIVALWEQFVAMSRNLDADGKKELGDRWSEYSDGAPKPNIDTAKAEDLEFLIGEAQAIIDGEAESDPQEIADDDEEISSYDKFVEIRDMLTKEQKTQLKNWWSEYSGGKPVPKASELSEADIKAMTVEAIRLQFDGTIVVTGDDGEDS